MIELLNANKELVAAVVGGLIGILGSVAILFASHYLKSMGKISFNMSSYKFILSRRDDMGGEKHVSTIDETGRIAVTLAINLYNSSEVPKSLQDLKIEIRAKASKIVYSTTPRIYSGSHSGYYVPYEKLEVINFPPKELVPLNCNVWIDENVADFKGELVFYATAKYPNGRNFKTRLFTTTLK